jgi:hypothetical protein
VKKKEKDLSKRKGTRAIKKEVIDSDAQEAISKARPQEEFLIKLNPDQQEELSNYIQKRLNAALNSQEWIDVYSNIKRYREYYEKGVPRSEFPIQGAHDYRSFTASSATDGMRSRLIGLFATDPIVRLEGRNEEGVKNQLVTEKWLDYHHDVNLNLPEKGEVIVSYISIEGHTVLYSPYRLEIDQESLQLRTKKVFVSGTKKLLVDINDPQEISDAQSKGFVEKSPLEFEVEEVTAPEIIKNYPDLEIHSLLDYICPENTNPMDTPAWEAVTQYLTYDSLLKMDEEGEIYKGALKKVKNFLVKGKESKKDTSFGSGKGTAGKEDNESFEKEANDSLLKCRAVWGSLKIPGQKYLQKVMVLYHEDSNTVLVVKPNKIIGKPSPIFHVRLIKIPNRFSGIGCMELSIPGEKAINDLTNYVLDETRIFSSIPFTYKEGRVNTTNPFEFWKGIKIKKEGDIMFPNIPDRRPVDLSVASFLRANTERRNGIGDLQLGRESDVTGKQPPTARGVMSVLREGQVRFGLLNFSMIGELLKWASYEMKVFQQYLTGVTVVDAVGEDGKKLFPDGMTRTQIMGSFKFVPNTNAQNLIRELDLEVNMMLYNLLKDNKLLNVDLGFYYNLTQDIIQGAGKKKKLLQPLSVYRKLLNVPAPEDRMLDLNPQEQQFAQTLIQAGVDPETVKAKVEEMRKGMENPQPEQSIPPEDLATMMGGEGKKSNE